jgi:hypothetical protein
MTASGERRAVFDDHNLFFLAVAGLAAAGVRLDRLVEEFGRGALGPTPLPRDAVRSDAILSALLGVISLRERLRGHLADAAAGAPTDPAPVTPSAASHKPSSRDILR